jgi:hypothetical protein
MTMTTRAPCSRMRSDTCARLQQEEEEEERQEGGRMQQCSRPPLAGQRRQPAAAAASGPPASPQLLLLLWVLQWQGREPRALQQAAARNLQEAAAMRRQQQQQVCPFHRLMTRVALAAVQPAHLLRVGQSVAWQQQQRTSPRAVPEGAASGQCAASRVGGATRPYRPQQPRSQQQRLRKHQATAGYPPPFRLLPTRVCSIGRLSSAGQQSSRRRSGGGGSRLQRRQRRRPLRLPRRQLLPRLPLSRALGSQKEGVAVVAAQSRVGLEVAAGRLQSAATRSRQASGTSSSAPS